MDFHHDNLLYLVFFLDISQNNAWISIFTMCLLRFWHIQQNTTWDFQWFSPWLFFFLGIFDSTSLGFSPLHLFYLGHLAAQDLNFHHDNIIYFFFLLGHFTAQCVDFYFFCFWYLTAPNLNFHHNIFLLGVFLLLGGWKFNSTRLGFSPGHLVFACFYLGYWLSQDFWFSTWHVAFN